MLRWPEGEGYDKGFLIIAYPVRALTDDVARSRMRNGSTASFPDLFSTSSSVEPSDYIGHRELRGHLSRLALRDLEHSLHTLCLPHVVCGRLPKLWPRPSIPSSVHGIMTSTLPLCACCDCIAQDSNWVRYTQRDTRASNSNRPCLTSRRPLG